MLRGLPEQPCDLNTDKEASVNTKEQDDCCYCVKDCSIRAEGHPATCTRRASKRMMPMGGTKIEAIRIKGDTKTNRMIANGEVELDDVRELGA